MAVLLSQTIRPDRRYGLYATPMGSGPEGADQTFKKGAPLVFSSGLLVVAAADVVAGIVGFAEHDGHNAAAGTTTVFYTPALPHVIFEGVLEDAGTPGHVLVAANIGGVFALQVDGTTGAWFLDENDTTLHSCRIINAVDPLGTVRGRVNFIVVADTTLYGT